MHGPYDDFRRMAANRLVADDRIRQAVYMSISWRTLADKERARADTLEVALRACRQWGDAATDRAVQYRDNYLDLRSNQQGLRTWATIGKAGTVAFILTLMWSVTVSILNAAR